MALIDVPETVETAATGARQCRMILHRAVTVCQHSCEQVARIVTQHGRADVATTLGDDANELATLYNQLKAIADAHQHPAPDLPA